MPSTKGRAAKQAARAWLDGQSELPIGAVLHMHAHDPEVQGRLFTVDYFARSLRQQVHLIEFLVLDDGTIVVQKDQRTIADEAGKQTESRFFEVMAVRTEITPSWFRMVKRAKWYFDKRGIDAFAYVDHRKGEPRLEIPIQLKSSTGGAKKYAEKHPLCAEHGVVVLVINPNKSDDQVCQYVYATLGAVRKKKIKDGTRFDELLSLLAAGKQ